MAEVKLILFTLVLSTLRYPSRANDLTSQSHSPRTVTFLSTLQASGSLTVVDYDRIWEYECKDIYSIIKNNFKEKSYAPKSGGANGIIRRHNTGSEYSVSRFPVNQLKAPKPSQLLSWPHPRGRPRARGLDRCKRGG